MPPRSQPTARQERLGAELRKLRLAAGKTAREAADLLGVTSVQISQVESGKAGVSAERLRRLASHYACSDEDLVAALADMATDRTRGWWEEYRGILPPSFLDLAELEYHATFLRTIGIVHIPGILQTEAYARAVYSYVVPQLPSSEFEPRVAHRLKRRVVLDEARTKVEVVIHESALRIRVADCTTAVEQLQALLDLTDCEHVSLYVIPLDIDSFAGANCSMLHAGAAVPQLDTVLLDAPVTEVQLDAEAQLNKYRMIYRKVKQAALSSVESRTMIHGLIRELQEG